MIVALADRICCLEPRSLDTARDDGGVVSRMCFRDRSVCEERDDILSYSGRTWPRNIPQATSPLGAANSLP